MDKGRNEDTIGGSGKSEQADSYSERKCAGENRPEMDENGLVQNDIRSEVPSSQVAPSVSPVTEPVASSAPSSGLLGLGAYSDSDESD